MVFFWRAAFAAFLTLRRAAAFCLEPAIRPPISVVSPDLHDGGFGHDRRGSLSQVPSATTPRPTALDNAAGPHRLRSFERTASPGQPGGDGARPAGCRRR